MLRIKIPSIVERKKANRILLFQYTHDTGKVERKEICPRHSVDEFTIL